MQKRFWEFEADDRTADLNYALLGERPPGTYYGYDMLFKPGSPMVLFLRPGDTAFRGLDENGDPWVVSLLISKQGIKITEDDEVSAPIDVTGADIRVDAVICEHEYNFSTGGSEALYSVIKGTAGVATPPAIPAGAVRVGDLYLPINCTSLNQTGVIWRKAKVPNFGGKGMFPITSRKGSLAFEYDNDTETTYIDLFVNYGSPDDANELVDTGFSYREYSGSQVNFPNNTNGWMFVRNYFNGFVLQEFVTDTPLGFFKFTRKGVFGSGWAFSPWFNESIQIASPAQTVRVTSEIVEPGGGSPNYRRLIVEDTTRDLGTFIQSTPNPIITSLFYIVGFIVPDAENPLIKLYQPGKYFAKIGIGASNTLVDVYFTVTGVFNSTTSLFNLVYEYTIDGFPDGYKVLNIGPTIGADRTSYQEIGTGNLITFASVFAGSGSVSFRRYDDLVFFEGFMTYPASTDLASSLAVVIPENRVNPKFLMTSGGTPVGGPRGMRCTYVEATGSVYRDAWVKFTPASTPGQYNMFITVNGVTVVPSGGATVYFDGIVYQHIFR